MIFSHTCETGDDFSSYCETSYYACENGEKSSLVSQVCREIVVNLAGVTGDGHMFYRCDWNGEVSHRCGRRWLTRDKVDVTLSASSAQLP